ncbi:MAG: hypothetical protein QF486_05830 [Candidatus Woesearchaeota archaeon]|jgi:pimeloyl-ACP methyl ester carboxylesterase|nr:hypothetical protein [Candidatus Woesearchaeota archaeon]
MEVRKLLAVFIVIAGLSLALWGGTITGLFGLDLPTTTLNLTERLGPADSFLVQTHENVTTEVDGELLTLTKNHADVREVELTVSLLVGSNISQQVLSHEFQGPVVEALPDLTDLPSLIEDTTTLEDAADEEDDAAILNYNFLLIPKGMQIQEDGSVSGDLGKIDFGGKQNYTNIHECLVVEDNLIGLDTAKCVQLNKTATLTINSAIGSKIEYSDDGTTWGTCDDTTSPSCTNIQYDSGDVSFTVDHFTLFRSAGEAVGFSVSPVQQQGDLLIQVVSITAISLDGGNLTLDGHTLRNETSTNVTAHTRDTTSSNASLGNKTHPGCSGEVMTCGEIADEPSCDTQRGCTWDGDSCEGTAEPCSNITSGEGDCSAQFTCSWGDTKHAGYRIFLDFNTTIIPDNANITLVNLTLTATKSTGEDNITIAGISKPAADYTDNSQGNNDLYNGTNGTSNVYFEDHTNFTSSRTLCRGFRDNCAEQGDEGSCGTNTGCQWNGSVCLDHADGCNVAGHEEKDNCLMSSGCYWKTTQQLGLNASADIESALTGSDVFTLGIRTPENNETNSTAEIVMQNDDNITNYPVLIIQYEINLPSDIKVPAVTKLNITPKQFARGNTTTIDVNVTDDNITDTVFANITIPNGSNTLIQLFNRSGTEFNNTFVTLATDTSGEYNLTILANDTSNNKNHSVYIEFNVTKFASCPDSTGNWVITGTEYVTSNKTCSNINISAGAIMIINATSIGNESILIKADNITVEGDILLNGTGYQVLEGISQVDRSSDDEKHGPGGSHGGGGGANNNDPPSDGGVAYGDPVNPFQAGSGGGHAGTTDDGIGGAGGGILKLEADVLIVNGTISADGISGIQSFGSGIGGGGGGGTIHIIANHINGTGNITARGGGGGGGAGGGGRMRIEYNHSSLTRDNYDVSPGEADADPGSLIILDVDDDTVYLIEDFRFPSAALQNMGSIRIIGVNITMNATLNFSVGMFSMVNASIEGAPENTTTNLTMNATNMEIKNSILTSLLIVNITSTNTTIDESSVINASDTAYDGPGAGADDDGGHPYGSGAGHGGKGLDSPGTPPTLAGLSYDSARNPVNPGSQGGRGDDGNSGAARGGGAVFIRGSRLNMSGNITVSGGTVFTDNDAAGGGSGGSINILVDTLVGNGRLEAEGASSNENASGGGGRIMVRANSSTLDPSRSSVSSRGNAFPGSLAFVDLGTGVFNMRQSWTFDETPVYAFSMNLTNVVATYNVSINISGAFFRMQNSTLLLAGNVSLDLDKNLTVNTTEMFILSSTIGNFTRFNVTSVNVSIDSGSFIILDASGFDSSDGPGGGQDGGSFGGPGGHGGAGRAVPEDTPPLPRSEVYDDPLNPIELGSGGGKGGQRGGGAVFIRADMLNMSGNISTDGGASDGPHGGGSGGTINVLANTLHGDGKYLSRGIGSSGGGGGMILLSYNTTTSSIENMFVDGASGSNPGTSAMFDMDSNSLNIRQSWRWVKLAAWNFTLLNVTNAITLANDSLNITASVFHLTNASIEPKNNESIIGNITIGAGTSFLVDAVINKTSRLNITSPNFTFTIGSIIIADGTGFSNDLGPGAGMASGSGDGAGAGHGGLGGPPEADPPMPEGQVYDDPTNPVEHGSGGGSEGVGGPRGGFGGGVVIIRSNFANLSGNISVQGVAGSGLAGGGSGGSINILVNELVGNGTFDATGTGARSGGGMIFVGYNTTTISIEKLNTSGSSGGEQGTTAMYDEDDNSLNIRQGWRWVKQASWNYTLLNVSNARTKANDTLNISASVFHLVDSIIEPKNNVSFIGNFTLSAGTSLIMNSVINRTSRFNITSPNFTLTAGSVILSDGAGFASDSGPAFGVAGATLAGSGAGHGGKGMPGESVPNQPYDNPLNPEEAGSGGASESASFLGGRGGGVVFIRSSFSNLSGNISVDGVLPPPEGTKNTGGAGGSINILVGNLTGGGFLTAKGANASSGGMILVQYNFTQIPITNLEVQGDGGAEHGTAAMFDLDDNSLNIRQGWRWVKQASWNYTLLNVSNARTKANDTLNISASVFHLINSTIEGNTNDSFIGNFTLSAGTSLIMDSTINRTSVMNITSPNFTLTANSFISADKAGFIAEKGPGAGTSATEGGSGAGHGGKGAEFVETAGGTMPGGSPYDRPFNPTQPGSGGGDKMDQGGAGAGGGVVFIRGNQVNISGNVSAKGENYQGTESGAGGSGGTINVIVNNLTGNGNFDVKGGDNSSGGMITVRTNFSTLSIENADVSGKSGGGIGTIAFFELNASSVQIRGGWRWVLTDLSIWNYATINVTQAVTKSNSSLVLNVTNLILYNASIIPNPSQNLSNLSITAQHILMDMSQIANVTRLNISTTNMTMDVGSTITTKGFGAETGPGAGPTGATEGNGSGGSHGGTGAPTWLPTENPEISTESYGSTYGSAFNPVELGSGGGGGGAAPEVNGSLGGGLVFIEAGLMNISGNLSVDGFGDQDGGGGSGGSINIVTDVIDGQGYFLARGRGGTGEGGGGGRIMIKYNTSLINDSHLLVNGTNGGEIGTGGRYDIAHNHLYGIQNWEWSPRDANLNLSNATMLPGTTVRGAGGNIIINSTYIMDGATYNGRNGSTQVQAEFIFVRNATFNGTSAGAKFVYLNRYHDNHSNIMKDSTFKLGQLNTSGIEFGRIANNITNLSSFLVFAEDYALANSSQESGLNVESQVTFFNTLFLSPRATRDPEDDGVFETCPSSACTEVSFSNQRHIFNVTGFTSYGEETNPGTGKIIPSRSSNAAKKAAAAEEAPDAPAAPAPAPAPAAAPAAKAAGVSTATSQRRSNIGKLFISQEDIEAEEVACAQGEAGSQVKIKKASTPPVPTGFSVLADPFAMDCAGDNVVLTLSVSENYENITTLKCNNEGCEFVGVEKPTEFECGGVSYSELVLSEYSKEGLEIDRKRVLTKQATITPENPRVQVEGYTIEFKDVTTPFQFNMKPHALSLPQVDKHIALLVDPIEIIQNSGKPQTVTISVKNPRTNNVLEGEFPAFRKQNGDMQSIVTNYDGTTVKGSFETNTTSVLGFYGIRCDSCDDVTMSKEYDGGSRQALILIHGFMSSPATWLPMIEEFRLTKQPQQVYSIAYPSTLEFKEISRQTRLLIEGTLREFDTVDIVAHSMGGLITQQVLKDMTNKEFEEKIRKLILVGTPNDGSPAIDIYKKVQKKIGAKKNIVPFLAASPTVVSSLSQGVQLPRMPGKEYVVLAGNRPFTIETAIFTVESDQIGEFFKEPNDGVVSVSSAQNVGGQPVENKCEDYFEMELDHGQLIDHSVPRKVIARLVAQQVEGKVTLGYNQYIRLNINNCQPGYTYAVVGQEIDEDTVADPLNCKCGNGVCGNGEDKVNCPSDCLIVERRAKNLLPIVIYGFLIAMIALILWGEVKKHKYGKALPRIFRLGKVAIALLLGATIGLHHYLYQALIPAYVLLALIVVSVLVEFFRHLRLPHIKVPHPLRDWKPHRRKPVMVPALRRLQDVFLKVSLPKLKPIRLPSRTQIPSPPPKWDMPKVKYKPFVIRPQPTPQQQPKTSGKRLQEMLGKRHPSAWTKPKETEKVPTPLHQLKKQFGTSYARYLEKTPKAQPHALPVQKKPRAPVHKPRYGFDKLKEQFRGRVEERLQYKKPEPTPIVPAPKVVRKPYEHKSHMLDNLKKSFDTNYKTKTSYVRPAPSTTLEPTPVEKRQRTHNESLEKLRGSFGTNYQRMVKPKPTIKHKPKEKPKQEEHEYKHAKRLRDLKKKFGGGKK